jgi:cytoskeleton protein RodZ
MSDGGQAQTQSGPVASDVGERAPTAGEMLRQAREAAGMHVGALAVALKVPVRKLEALEADRYEQLTDSVFVRALASSVCRNLKIDPQPVLERLPQMAAPRLVGSSASINTPFRAPSDGAPPTWLDQLSRPVFLAVFALLLGALVLILLPKAQPSDAAAPVANSVVTHVPSAPAIQPATTVPAAPDAVTAVVSPAAAAPVAAAPTIAPMVAAAAAVVPSAGAASAAKPAGSSPAASLAAAAAQAKAVADAPAAAASGLIVFRAKSGPSWVEVVDAKGAIPIRKVLEKGETAGASGALPLRVTIGRIDSTEVQVRGKPFNLKSVSNDNVARFEVK